MSDVEVYTADRETRRAVAQIRQAPMTVGNAWRKDGRKDGEILWGALEMSVGIARDLGLSPRSDYALFPIINGLVFANAEAYRILLLRHGGDLVFTADTAKECTVVVTGTNGTTYPPFTVTADEAKTAGWGAASGLQTKDPRAILRARASRRAIKLYQPQVLAAVPAHLWGDEDPGPVAVRSAAAPEPPTAAPRQVAVGGTTQHKLRAAIDRLTPGQRHDVAQRWSTELLPPVDVLDLDQFMAALDIILDVIADDEPPADDYEPDPDREQDADNYRYSVPEDEDPGRPFA